MNRRTFLAGAAAGVLAGSVRGLFAEIAEDRPLRIGLIGCGWYGKCDLFRFIQVAPVEVVSLCDVDQRMLAEAADLVSTRQPSRRRPRLYSDYRAMLAERDLDVVVIGTPDHLV
jgi:predicted dehydrogenase